MLQAVTNKHSLVRRRLCHLAYTALVDNCFWHFARPAIFDSQLLNQNRYFCLYPTCIRRPRYGGFPSEYRARVISRPPPLGVYTPLTRTAYPPNRTLGNTPRGYFMFRTGLLQAWYGMDDSLIISHVETECAPSN